MRARLAIAVSGRQVEIREVVLRDKPAELLAASPKATVPVLVLPDGEVIDESLDIMLWALRQNDPECWLAPVHGSMPAMLALIAENDGGFKNSLDRYKYPNRHTKESGADVAGFAQVQRDEGARWLGQLDRQLESGCLYGPRASLADMAIAPFVRQFAHTDDAWFALQPWPRLQAWLARFEAASLYLAVMDKRAAWRLASR